MDDERPQQRSWREGAATRVNVAAVVRQVDLAATGTFAVEGAIAGVKDHLDIFGVIVLASVTGVGGGVVRDVLIGDTPPAAVRDRLYIPLALVAGFVVFLLDKPVENIPTWLFNGLDAVGLSLFTVAGSQKSSKPAVLRVDMYAVAALLGGVIVVAGSRLGGVGGRPCRPAHSVASAYASSACGSTGTCPTTELKSRVSASPLAAAHVSDSAACGGSHTRIRAR